MTPTMVIVGGGHDGLGHRYAIRNVANDSGGSDGCRDGVDIDRALYLGTKGWPERSMLAQNLMETTIIFSIKVFYWFQIV